MMDLETMGLIRNQQQHFSLLGKKIEVAPLELASEIIVSKQRG